MQTTVVIIPTELITDWDSFHTVFEARLGFPGYYGRNMNAWIDCLTYADDAHAGMVAHPVSKGELLTLRLDHAAEFEKRCPEQYRALVECTAFVNYRRLDTGGEPVLALLMSGWFSAS
ncbi:MAG: barstar family protein [Phenylobacterium sp.]|nr:barstar family protein [Phenylobacterium sp.]